MTVDWNKHHQPVGALLQQWQPPPWPMRQPLVGRYCTLEPLDPQRHAEQLFAANSDDQTGSLWTYMAYGPFTTFPEYRDWLTKQSSSKDPLFFAVLNEHSAAVGLASYLDIKPAMGSIEVGHLLFSPRLQRTKAATEAMYLMMAYAFEFGYRRYQWKCNALNAPSRAAAQRLGLSFEGIFRNATVVKGRNRDTAWYAAINTDWPALKNAFETWLSPANFDEHGQQRMSLSSLTAPLLHRVGETT